jgi:signal transduction histidine kinase
VRLKSSRWSARRRKVWLARRLAMSLRTRLRISIVALVVTVVTALSVLHIHSVIEARFEDSVERASAVLDRVQGSLSDQISLRLEQRTTPAGSQVNLQDLVGFATAIIENDDTLSTMLEQVMATSQSIVEIVVTGENNRILASSQLDRQGQRIQQLPSVDDFARKSLLAKLNEVLTQAQEYEVDRPLGFQGQQEPAFTVRVIMSTVLLRKQIQPQLENLAVVLVLSLFLSALLAVVASNVAFRPLARIGDIIDRIARGEEAAALPRRQAKEIAVVESKLDLLGKQFRGAQASAVELRTNIDQLLDRMEDAVLLFGRDDRLMMAGSGVERLLGSGRWVLMGKTLEEIFPGETVLGAVVQSAVHLRRDVKDHPIELDRDGMPTVQLLVTVELIEDFPRRERVGTLLRLRDADPRRQIESQLDVSTRLAAISELTSGAAHEIKNPLNSIALHLEILKSKLDGITPGGQEIEVITREIARLDRVVKTFLDFQRPVELQMGNVDLVALVNDVASLMRPTAQKQGVQIQEELPASEAVIQGDRDLLKQALLNVVTNAIEAMKDGGLLEIAVRPSRAGWGLLVRDQGVGIPPELRHKIYKLYFTTKGKGSGIGLAMTFRVVQLHGGTIDFASEPGKGTEFRLLFPAVREAPRQALPAASAAPDA